MNAHVISQSQEVAQPAHHPTATTQRLPKLKISTIFAMTFGFFGVNMAFSLQSSQMS